MTLLSFLPGLNLSAFRSRYRGAWCIRRPSRCGRSCPV